ncbi:TIGR03667 family PPOX class F420-dependent oxidoreductase [Actinokineospora sp. NBRC 105648]|uniref:TIGR03667 family PPOX class F420-dependent oxidoreductase n=1 Tax=Actinokineospora sp. NBRC 105648 TaxID=3032206 RepID=UPI0025545C5A|nr:TIGR03667 family PPOX class F420-dependent oxidoreductase [Actinokineospora sp. NBRC 105648]
MTLLDQDTEFGARVAERLRTDLIAWVTSVDRAGTPQPAPVWFVWEADSATVLIYSTPDAKRVERARANPRTSVHLSDEGLGQNFAVFTGELAEAPDAPSIPDNADYLAKYADRITEVFGGVEQFAAKYTVALRFRPSRVRGF